jgi:hypothetical protein
MLVQPSGLDRQVNRTGEDAMFILTIYELDEYGLHVFFQQINSDELPLQTLAVRWFATHYPEHFEDGMFHDSPSDSIEDNYQAILLWCEYAENSGGLDLLIRAADTADDLTALE